MLAPLPRTVTWRSAPADWLRMLRAGRRFRSALDSCQGQALAQIAGEIDLAAMFADDSADDEQAKERGRQGKPRENGAMRGAYGIPSSERDGAVIRACGSRDGMQASQRS